MKTMLLSFFLILVGVFNSQVWATSTRKWPTVGISVLVRNKAHTLPYFLSCINNLDYPKDRLYLWIYSDFNEDNSVDILEKWSEIYANKYNGVYITTNKTSGALHADEEKPSQWSTLHFSHVISLREQALNFARKMWADYLFMVDADVFITNANTLKILVQKELPVVAPMLMSDGIYSNFWCGMTDSYYYLRTDDYRPTLERERRGCFAVPMVHTAVLVDLGARASDRLTYVPDNIAGYDGPNDDIIAFAVNARNEDIQLSICNDHEYGFVPVPLDEKDDLDQDREQLLNIKLEAISKGTPLPLLQELQQFVSYPAPDKLGCDEIYMINLPRRPERRRLMQLAFRELGLNVTLFKAVDGRDIDMQKLSELSITLLPGYEDPYHGRDIDMQKLSELSITLLPGYEDPYHGRPMTAGEVGCFLSHYYIWKEIERRGLSLTLVLEDDVRFVPFARRKLLQLLQELEPLTWDLLYLGRKVLEEEEEAATARAVRPGYSYWTLGYLLRASGARRLLRSEPLARLLPVDEFLPIMFDRHPNATWKAAFPSRRLVALSAAPLLVFPTHYTGEPGYLSDTEQSAPLPARPAPPAPAGPQRDDL